MEITVVTLQKDWNYKFQLDPNTTVRDLKSNIARVKGTPEEIQNIIFAGLELEDENLLSDYSCNNNTITLIETPVSDERYKSITFTFTIEKENGEKYDISVKPITKIKDLIHEICLREGINEYLVNLFFNERELKDKNKSFDYYRIPDGSTLQLKIEEINKGSMPIFVKTLTGKRIELMFDPTDTVRQLKLQIYEREGVPLEMQRLIFNGKQIHSEEDAMLQDLSIGEYSTVHMVLGR